MQVFRSIQERARQFWNAKHSRDVENLASERPALDPIDYTKHWFLYNHAVSKALTGDCGKYWLDEVGRRYLVPAPERVLAIGCGPAFVEEQLLERDFAGRLVGYELSPAAVESAEERLRGTPFADRVELRCRDPLEDGIPDHSFDAIFIVAAIHHFVEIDRMFALMHRVLRPGGLLIYDEYVGPDLNQYPPELLALLNRVNECLAPELRRDFETGEVRERVELCSEEWMLANDPTEGIHASRILPLTRRYFQIVEERRYGGAVLRPLMSRILPNFDFVGDPKDQTIAQLLVLLERELTEGGVIDNHNVVVVARPRAEPLPEGPG